MKIPAIRAQIGVWVYYVATLSFEQVSEYVKPVDDELHKSELLRDMLQRSITENYKNIATYIKEQKELFFNSLVLAVYDGDPQWHEVRLEYDNGEDFYDLGLLELTGKEKIFPIDGQHRVEGIKRVLEESDKFNKEKIPVVLIGHKNDAEGMQRARRMFSTLNRYAKPVSPRDIVVLDEDDIIAITCRNLIDNNDFFSKDRIFDSKNKSISNKHNEFTTIITFYECIEELLSMFLMDKEIKNDDGKSITSKNKKIERYIKVRPNDTEVDAFYKFCDDYWKDMIENIDDLREYRDQEPPNGMKFRHKDGGSILFRPTALLSFISATLRIKEQSNLSYKEIFKQLNKLDLELNSKMWRRILWDPFNGKMLTTNKTTVVSLIIYAVDKNILSTLELDKLKLNLKAHIGTEEDDSIEEYLEQINL